MSEENAEVNFDSNAAIDFRIARKVDLAIPPARVVSGFHRGRVLSLERESLVKRTVAKRAES